MPLALLLQSPLAKVASTLTRKWQIHRSGIEDLTAKFGDGCANHTNTHPGCFFGIILVDEFKRFGHRGSLSTPMRRMWADYWAFRRSVPLHDVLFGDVLGVYVFHEALEAGVTKGLRKQFSGGFMTIKDIGVFEEVLLTFAKRVSQSSHDFDAVGDLCMKWEQLGYRFVLRGKGRYAPAEGKAQNWVVSVVLPHEVLPLICAGRLDVIACEAPVKPAKLV